MLARSLIVLSLFSAALCDPLGRRVMKVHESRSDVPFGFVKRGRAAPDTVLSMRIALTQQDPEGLTDALMAVSTPGNARYQRFLTQDQVAAFTAPTAETSDAVISFLKENGINPTIVSPAGDWLAFEATVGTANELFDADFHVFEHQDTGVQSLVTTEYSVPEDLSEHIQLVHPSVSFSTGDSSPQLQFQQSEVLRSVISTANGTLQASCLTNVTPACLQTLYGIPSSPAVVASNTIGIAGFINQFANLADLSTFLKAFRPDIPPQTGFSLDTLDGGSNDQNPTSASSTAGSNMQYTVGLATNVPATFISCGTKVTDNVAGFMDWANFVNNLASPPSVVSISYGMNENTVSFNVASALCNVYAALGAKGISVLFSSGNGGVSGSQPVRCTTFQPTFPSSCPFLTSVGSTAINATTGAAETAATFTSGGFSNYFPLQSFQIPAVSHFLSVLGNTNAGKFNTSGRGFPDVAVVGQNVEFVLQQQNQTGAGTGISSPIFASIIALINDRLAQNKRGPLGFLNPLLYGAAAATFNDIQTGRNPGCSTVGFPAVAGWDPVSGLGSPNFTQLLAVAEIVSGL